MYERIFIQLFYQKFINQGSYYLLQPQLIGLHILSDLLIALTYYSILLFIVFFVRSRADVPFPWVLLIFSTFIVACGTSHLMEVWTLWYPVYWLSGLIKAITAFVSVVTAIKLVPLLPKALALVSLVQLDATNIMQRMSDELEIKVQEQTADLAKINESLQLEILEHKLIQEALRESEERFRTIFDQAAVGIAQIAMNGSFLLVNQRFCQILGYTQKELQTRICQDITYAEDLNKDLDYFHQMLSGKIQTHSMEKRYICKDNSIVWVYFTMSLVRESCGEPKCFVAVIEDISERKRMEKVLRESEEQFRLIAYTAPVMIWVSGTDRFYNYYNKVWLEFTGKTSQQDVGNGWLESIHPEDRERCFHIYTTAFEARQNFKMEYRLRRFDGEYRWMLDTGIPRYTEDGRFAGYIASCVDITERKWAEEKIQASLVEKEVLLKEIYHRVKNNLQVISSLLNLQSEYIKNKEDLAIFQQSQLRIESMALIHQKLYQSQDLARIDFGEYIRDLVASVFSTYEVHTNVISLVVNIENVLLSLDAAIPCGLIITELVSNSLKYAFPKGRTGEIFIELKVEDNSQYILTVSDNGVGLPTKFDFKNTTSLGLQLVDALIKQLSGNIKIQCHNGVNVKITFPYLSRNLNGRN